MNVQYACFVQILYPHLLKKHRYTDTVITSIYQPVLQTLLTKLEESVHIWHNDCLWYMYVDDNKVSDSLYDLGTPNVKVKHN